jgi:hypothetical protein
MNNPDNAHIKITLSPNNVAPGAQTDGTILFTHSHPDGATFTLSATITGTDYRDDLYAQTQTYSPHRPHQRIFNFVSPTTPGLYEVVAFVESESGEKLESSKSELIVRTG